MSDETKPNLLDRALGLFSDVRAKEGATALLMMTNVFLVMFAYYVIKTIREGLILADAGGAEFKTYASGFMAVALLPILGLYNWLSATVSTRKLTFSVVGFFIVCIQLFFLALQADVPHIGKIFFVWVGIFSLSAVAQFWSFANELYSREEGERLFPIVGLGMTGGAFAGSMLAGDLFDEGTSAGVVLQVAAGLLLLHGVLYAIVMARPEAQRQRPSETTEKKSGLLEALQGFRLLATRPYIGLLALLILLLNLVNTTGEYILSKYAVATAWEALEALPDRPDAPRAWVGAYISAFYGDFFLWVNIVAVALQAFVASRLVKHLGIAGVLFALPIVSGLTYFIAAFGSALGGMALFRWAKTAENATDYSIMNTARAMLWLPTSREEKYKAKQTIDSFVVRIGDLLAAGVVFVGTQILELSPQGFAGINVGLVVAWFGLAYLLWRSYRRLSAEKEAAQGEAEQAA